MRNIDSVNTYRSTINRLHHGPASEKAAFLKKLTDDTDTLLKAHIDNLWPTGNKIALSWIVMTIAIPLAVYFSIRKYERGVFGSEMAGIAAVASTGFHLLALWHSYDKNTQKPYNRDKLDKQFTERSDQRLSDLLTFIQNIHGINSDIESKKEVSLNIFDANEQIEAITDAYLNTQASIDDNTVKMTQLEKEIATKIRALKQSTAPPAYQETKTSAAEAASAADPETLVLMQQQANRLDEIFEKYTSKYALETHLEKNKDGLTQIQTEIINLRIELLDRQETHPKLTETLAENSAALNQRFNSIATNSAQYNAGDEILVSSTQVQGNRYGTFPPTSGENKGESQALLAP